MTAPYRGRAELERGAKASPMLLALLGLLMLLQYRLWFGEGGINERQSLEAQVATIAQRISD